MSAIDQALEANKEYAKQFKLGNLPVPPSKKLAVVCCMDARINVEEILGLKPGEAHIIRNAGGIVTEDTFRSLIISHYLLGIQEIMVINHTGCGMETFEDEVLRKELIEQADGIEPDEPRKFFAFKGVEHNLRGQIAKITLHPWIADEVKIRGFVYDVKAGTLEEVK